MYTYAADSDQIKTSEELFAYAGWRPWGNTNESLLAAATRLGIDTGAIEDELNVTGTFKSGTDVLRAFKMKINDAAMNPALEAAAKITVVSFTPAGGAPKPPAKKDYGPPRPLLARAAKKVAPGVYAVGARDDTDKDKTWLVGEDGSGSCSDVDGDSSPLLKKARVPKAV